eukprot:scpid108277/ scgid12860/ 
MRTTTSPRRYDTGKDPFHSTTDTVNKRRHSVLLETSVNFASNSTRTHNILFYEQKISHASAKEAGYFVETCTGLQVRIMATKGNAWSANETMCEVYTTVPFASWHRSAVAHSFDCIRRTTTQGCTTTTDKATRAGLRTALDPK